MNPEHRCREARKQAELARESDLADTDTSAMIAKAEQLLAAAKDRLEDERRRRKPGTQ